MFRWLTRLLQLAGKDSISFYENLLFKRSSIVFATQFSGLALAFAVNIFLARLYGEDVYGIYSYITSWTALLSVIALFGMDDVHLVRIPSLKLNHEKNNIVRLLRWSLSVNVVSIVCVVAIFYLAINFLVGGRLFANAFFFNCSLLIIIMLTIMNNLIAFLRALDRVVWGEIIDKIIRPVLFLLLLIIFFYFANFNPVVKTILANGFGLTGLIICMLIVIIASLKKLNSSAVSSQLDFSLRPNVRYVFLNIIYTLSIRLDILMLGFFTPTLMVGHYNVAQRIGDIFLYPIAIINLSMPTLISTERYNNPGSSAASVLMRVSKNSFYQCMLIGSFFLVAGYWIMQWYGKGFTEAFPILIIFFISCLVSAITGSADVFFIMEQQEKKVIYCRLVSLTTTAIIALILIPRWNMIGAAFSSLSGNIVYCALLELFFRRKYGFFVHPFSHLQNKIT